MMRTMNLLGCAAFVVAGVLAGCAPVNDDEAEDSEQALGRGNDVSWRDWREERQKRQSELDAYVAAHDDEAREFTQGAFATQGIPLVLFRLLPDLFPEYWGTPASQMSVLGMGPNPYNNKSAVPLGFGVSATTVLSTPVGSVKMAVATLACSYCHVGRVEGDDGKVIHLLGAPASQNVNILPPHVASASSPKLTAARLRAALLRKPLGWLFPNDLKRIPQEIAERTLYLTPGVAEKVVAEYKTYILGSASIFAATFGAHTYSAPNSPDPSAPRRGTMDAVGSALISRFDPAALPGASDLAPAPAEVDMMGTWRQADRPISHWDGGFGDKLLRNANAALGTVPNPAVDYRFVNAHATTSFTAELPAPPYPFDVDRRKASRGKPLFEKYCASCHAPGSSQTFAPEVTGTDPNRVDLLRPFGIAKLIAAGRAGVCREPTDCRNPDGSELRDEQIINPTGGYVALPLTGVWATAPYLHNGSVPNLRALMTGERPAKFYRGNIAYDKKNVGFVSDVATASTTEFDTSLAGFANTGHTSRRFLGDIDWNVETKKLDDLLEYMKTL